MTIVDTKMLVLTGRRLSDSSAYTKVGSHQQHSSPLDLSTMSSDHPATIMEESTLNNDSALNVGPKGAQSGPSAKRLLREVVEDTTKIGSRYGKCKCQI